MHNLKTSEGFPYAFDASACGTCQGKCCTGESGYINVSPTETEDIALFLNLKRNDFADKYLFQYGYKYSIKEVEHNGSYECAFYDRESNGCKIYEVRPTQCRTFPFWDYFKTRVDELKLECPGIIDV